MEEEDGMVGETKELRQPTRSFGVVAAILSATLFGSTHILGKLSYSGGSNGVTLTFLRAAFAVPVLFLLLKRSRVSMKLSREEILALLKVGILGPAATTVLLYSSYESISVGLATVLHFLYPVIVMLTGLVCFHERMRFSKILAVVLGFVGVLCSLDDLGQIRITGVVLAMLSSVSYTVYMIGVERTALSQMHHFKLSFYVSIISMVVSLLYGLVSGSLTLRLTPAAWGASFLVSMLVSVGAITLFQMAITRVGASTTAILSTLEPITSLILGRLILSESFTVSKGIGCALILASVVIVTRTRAEQSRIPS